MSKDKHRVQRIQRSVMHDNGIIRQGCYDHHNLDGIR